MIQIKKATDAEIDALMKSRCRTMGWHTNNEAMAKDL